jgi:hypothetical protein
VRAILMATVLMGESCDGSSSEALVRARSVLKRLRVGVTCHVVNGCGSFRAGMATWTCMAGMHHNLLDRWEFGVMDLQ